MKKYLSPGVAFGFIGGLVGLIAFLTFYYLDHSPLLNLNSFILELMITFLFVFLPIQYVKRSINRGNLRFWEGMTVGFFAYTVMAILTFTYLLVFIEYIDNSALREYIDNSKEYLNNSVVREENMISEEEFERQVLELNDVTSKDLALSALIKKMIMGLLLTPVASIIMRK